MNFDSSMVAPSILTLALVAMFAYGLYAIATKDRPPRARKSRHPETAPSNDTPYAPLEVDNTEEWEALAPYPDHPSHAAYEARSALSYAHPVNDWRGDAETHGAHTVDLQRDPGRAFETLQIEAPETKVAAPSFSPVQSPAPAIQCPRCRSSRIDTRNRARKAGSTIGSVAGATGAMTAALAGAETGAVVGSIAGPIGTIFGGLAGAVIAGLVGSAAGCAAGSAVGAAIDENVLDNHQCLACGHTFGVQ